MTITRSETLALLAFDEDKGRPYEWVNTALTHAFAATLLLDLQAAGSATVGDGTVITATAVDPGEPLLSEAWRSIADAKKGRTIRLWVERPTLLVKHLPNAVYDKLVRRGVLVDEGASRIFRREKYEEVDGRAHDDLVSGLAAVLDGGRDASDDDLLLLALLPACRLTNAVFPERDRKATEARIEELLAGDESGAADTAVQVARASAREVAAAVAAGVAAAGAH